MTDYKQALAFFSRQEGEKVEVDHEWDMAYEAFEELIGEYSKLYALYNKVWEDNRQLADLCDSMRSELP